MKAPALDQRRLLAMLAHSRAASEALAASPEPEALLRAFAAASLDGTVELCAVDLYENGTHGRRVACALSPELGAPGPALLQFADVPLTDRTAEASWASDDAAVAALAGDPAVVEELAKLGLASLGRVPLSIDGRVVGGVQLASRSVGIFDDLVERAQLLDLSGRAATALHSAWLRGQARTANRLRDEFLSIVSHELRTPLSTILGWSKLLHDGGLTPERSARGLDAIHRGALAQSQIIDELLDASRVLGGTLSLALESTALTPLVDEALASVAPLVAKKQLTVTLRTDGSSVLKGDPGRLRQLVRHLVSNAVKFTGSSGRIDVTITGTDAQVVLTIADSGTGIDPEFLSQMFDRFRQADGAVTRRHGGMGLGLAIVRRIVEAHQGEIHAESPGTGLGATFRVLLPRRQPYAPELPSAPAGHAPLVPTRDLRGARILVVDDELDVCEFAATVLGLRGALVTVAASAADALVALGKDTYDLLLSDIAMPDEDGVSLVRKALVAQPDLRSVALSALSQPADVRRAKAAGFELYLFKPVDPPALVQALETLLGTPREPGENL